ncbi:MAG: hypothetical protein H8D34_23215 [Chloroflexi bacterium]|nr:hypothetical protein [Chloroflexota bacterium]
MKNRIFYVLLAILALGAAVAGAIYWRTNYLAGVTLVNLPVPREEIPPYTLLKAEMFTSKQFPRALIDDSGGDYALTLDALAGQITTGTLAAELPIPSSLAVPPVQFRLADPELEVASIPISPVNGVGGQVQIGELVNIYRLMRAVDILKREEVITEETISNEVTMENGEALLVAAVPVVAVLSDQGLPASTDVDSPRPMRILVVAAPPEVVEAILEAVAMSELGDELLWVTLATPAGDG